MALHTEGQDELSYATQKLPSFVETAEQLTQWYNDRTGRSIQLSPVDTQSTSWSEHIVFQIEIEGRPLLHGLFKWNRFNANPSTCSYPRLGKTASFIGADPPYTTLGRYLKSITSSYKYLSFSIQWVIMDKIAIKRWVLRLETADTFREIILDDEGKEWYAKDLVVHDEVDTLMEASIFLPDPISSARVTYSGQYVDNDDFTSQALFDELTSAQIPLRWNSSTGVWELRSDLAVADDIAAPDITPPVYADLSGADLKVNRSDPNFEYFNVFYHLHAANDNFSRLGFKVVDFPLHFDAHGTEADQSSYVPSDVFPYLVFGDGGVDDGEDAEVIVHEYGHAVIHDIVPNTSYGAERNALDEGMCDYFAMSYTARLTDYNRSTIFDWDGHNEYWEGRTLTAGRTYPSDKLNNIYGDGILWVSALSEISELIGMEEADRLALHSLYSWFPFMLLSDAAQLYVQADTIINAGQYSDIITAVFCARGLLPGCEDTLISTTPLTAPYLGNSFDFSFNNEPLFIYTNNNEILVLEIFDLKGRLIYTEDWKSSDATFYSWDKAALPQGAFILRLSTPSSSYNFRIVKLW